MIPTKLTMTNFMCYRDNVAPLDFTGLHVACLCGDNGSGKSSVFDAITWALWGKASRGDNDELIYTGRNEMAVELEFQSGEDIYRVVRKYSRGPQSRPGQSMLDLQLFSNGAFKSISEHTKTETQDKIIGLLHLEYQTFINSALILQGRANEFSRKRPGERKEILANILDLSFYDELEQHAKINSEARKLESLTMERDISAIVTKLDDKPRLLLESNDSTEKLRNIELSVKQLEAEITVLRKKKEALAVRKEQLQLVQQQIASRNKDIGSWRMRLAESGKQVDHYNEILDRSSEIEDGFTKFKESAALEDKLNDKLKKSLELVNRRNKLAELITSVQNTFNIERKSLSVRVSELESKFSALPQLQLRQEELRQRQKDLNIGEQTIEAGKKSINDLKTAIITLSAHISQLTDAVTEIKQKIELLSHAGATCPLCESELEPESCRRLVDKLNSELQQNLSGMKADTAALSSKKAELSSLENQVSRNESTFKSERDSAGQQLAVVDKQIAETNLLMEELSAKKESLRILEDNLKNKNYAPDAQKSFISVDQELRELGYDPAVHSDVSQRKKSFQHFEPLYKELSEARLQLETQRKTRTDSESAISQLQKELEGLAIQSGQIEAELAALPETDHQLASLELQHNNLITDERTLRDNLARLRENLKQLDLLSEEKNEKGNLLRLYREEENLYTELAKDFSKRGIQALIIEESVPEIENEANLLLGKMTSNRMSLTLETQRDTKKGSTIETLDIKIADELGTRSYEMYSGGEAFRIDLALRIAISRLLVRRAGASMPILIIDEGFGTQDDSGLEKLIEAINSIQDDFEKLFIITHLDELKDKFPVLINVSKTSEGSLITVSQ
ncbi:MAG: AAA family ATPase [Dehalococcoidia bacterium]